MCPYHIVHLRCVWIPFICWKLKIYCWKHCSKIIFKGVNNALGPKNALVCTFCVFDWVVNSVVGPSQKCKRGKRWIGHYPNLRLSCSNIDTSILASLFNTKLKGKIILTWYRLKNFTITKIITKHHFWSQI